jgi:hypothetical protein
LIEIKIGSALQRTMLPKREVYGRRSGSKHKGNARAGPSSLSRRILQPA